MECVFLLLYGMNILLLICTHESAMHESRILLRRLA